MHLCFRPSRQTATFGTIPNVKAKGPNAAVTLQRFLALKKQAATDRAGGNGNEVSGQSSKNRSWLFPRHCRSSFVPRTSSSHA